MARLTRAFAVLIAVAALALVSTGLAAAGNQVPFHVTVTDEQVTLLPSCPVAGYACAAFGGSGQVTHLGKTSESGTTMFDAVAFIGSETHCAAENGANTLTAANGDQLFITFSGMVCATSPDFSSGHDTLTFTIVGGTGRFAGASGGGSLLSDFTLTSPTAGLATSTYDGTISSPGPLH
ncbi:MAG TPA: hypothetical protein VFI42_20520 [Thermomicrobiaceae bacterium]|nr:hypothetical protein [Thermomicrobiaceae bacterium]